MEKELWEEVLKILAIDIPEENFELWFKLTKPISFLDGKFKVAVPNIYLAVLAGGAQLIQSWLMTKFNPVQGGGTAKIINMQMMYLFPVITVMIGISLPAALSLYWVATTVFTVLQQIIVMYQFKSKNNEARS